MEEAHRDPAAEEHDCRDDEERREQAHRRARRPVRDVGAVAGVVPDEPPAGGRQLQDDHRDEGQTDEDVPRHERVHAEQDGRHFDDDRSKQEHSHCSRQPLVSVGVHVVPT